MKFPRRGSRRSSASCCLGAPWQGAATEESGGSSASSGSTDGSRAACVNRATDGCTPHVAMGHQVRVDALCWEVTSVKTAGSMGDTEYGTYKPDSDGTIAAIGSGADPLWFDDIGPDATMRSKVVFDVPPSALSKQISVRFGELGFGTTKGCIDLPQAAL